MRPRKNGLRVAIIGKFARGRPILKVCRCVQGIILGHTNIGRGRLSRAQESLAIDIPCRHADISNTDILTERHGHLRDGDERQIADRGQQMTHRVCGKVIANLIGGVIDYG